MEVPKVIQDGKIFSIILHIINALFVLTAFIGVIAMIANMVNYKHYLDLLGSNTSWIIAILVVGCALLLILIAVIGFLGVLAENCILLKIYIAIVSVLMLLLLIGGAVAYANRESTFDQVQKNMIESLKLYQPGEPEFETIVWDDIQQWYNCCGVEDLKDWAKYHDSYRGKLTTKPDSCKSEIGKKSQQVYVDGCLMKLDEQVKLKHWSIFGAISGIFLYLIFAICMAYMVHKGIDEEEYLIESRVPSEKGLDNTGRQSYPSLEDITSEKDVDIKTQIPELDTTPSAPSEKVLVRNGTQV